ncbi:hypothetical protein [Marinobacter sp.]|uniref:hypothetical protein n=1 Tax=Marinobacter sp. TaxID=50741 RepID=UPI003568D6E6
MTNTELDLSKLNGEALKVDLKWRLTDAYKALQSAVEVNRQLSQLGVGISTPDATIVGSLVISAFLKEWESKLTREYSGGTHARVDLRTDFQMSTREARDVLYKSQIDENDFSSCADALLAAFPFEECAKHARLQAVTLEDRGLQKCADQLATSLHLVRYEYSNFRPAVRTQDTRLICPYNFGSFYFGDHYASEDPRAMQDLAQEFRVLEQEMGDVGITAAFAACAKALEGARLASRTKICEGGPVEFVAFKNHLDMRFSPEATDMLLAFLKLHSSKPVIDLSEV